MPDQDQNNQTQNQPSKATSSVPFAAPASTPVDDSASTPISVPTDTPSDDSTGTPALADTTNNGEPDVDAPVPNIPGVQDSAEEVDAPSEPNTTSSTMSDVISKINDSNNILVTLSSDPSVDEIAAAIGLSLFLDRAGKHTTAIYSGATPNALEFLNPSDTFETTTDTLQDFVIAISKDKADHLRYKLDGDYVKIFITPYKTRIAEEDLEFSYGDFNVDLILALDVKNGTDLDDALREHGRVMHDASVINITTDLPGKFGEIEWSDGSASSVSEMIARLAYGMKQKVPVEKDEATAFLTGIVAATDRFSNEKTSPETMQIASKLMTSGADQQLISQNISADDNGLVGSLDNRSAEDDSSLKVDHNESELKASAEEEEKPKEEPQEEPKLESKLELNSEPAEAQEQKEPTELEQPTFSEQPKPETTSAPAEEPSGQDLLNDLKAAESALSSTSPEALETPTAPEALETPTEKTIEPSTDFVAESLGEGTSKYGQMLEDALNEANSTPTSTVTPDMSAPAIGESIAPTPIASPLENPASAQAPEVASAPEINGVPEINYTQDEILPPPPAPPIDIDNTILPTPDPISAQPAPEPTPAPIQPAPAEVQTPTVAQPAMQDQVYVPQANDPSAFKIPGA